MLQLFEDTSAMLQADSFRIEVDDAKNGADLWYRQESGEQVVDSNFDIYAASSDEFEEPDMVMSITFETTTHTPDQSWARTDVMQPPFVPPGVGCELALNIHPFDKALQQQYGLDDAEWIEFGVYGTGEDARVSCSGPRGVCYDVTNEVPPARLATMHQQALERAI